METIVDTTRNALTDFDLAVSLTEASLNAQLAEAWYDWNDRTDCLALVGEAGTDGSVLELGLEKPVLSLAAPEAGPGQVKVSFRIAEGRLSRPGAAALDLAGRNFSFLTRLQRQAVTQYELYAISPEAGEAARRVMQGDAGAFTIECLYLNLNTVEAVSDAQVATAAAGLLETYFQAKGRRFLVNTTLRPRAPRREASFEVAELRFRVAPGALDYHGVVAGGLAMPGADAEAGLGPWATAERVDGRQALAAGVMALRGAKVGEMMRAGLEAAIRAEYERMKAANNGVERNGVYPEAELLGGAAVTLEGVENRIVVRSAPGRNSYGWTGDNAVHFRLVKTLEFILTPVKHRCYAVSGTFEIHLTRTRDVPTGEQRALGITTVNIGGEMVLQANSGTIGCDVRPTLSVSLTAGEQVISAASSNVLIEVFGDKNIDRDGVIEFSAFIRDQIDRMLVESCEKIDLGIRNFALIPPAEDAFAFSRPRFSAAGDLMLDIVYLAVLGEG